MSRVPLDATVADVSLDGGNISVVIVVAVIALVALVMAGIFRQ